MTALRAAFCAALFFWLQAQPALADDVTLTSRDGTVSVSGSLLGYDGEFYRVDTVYGVLTVDGTGVLCKGPGCPDTAAYVAEFDFSGARTMGEVLLPALVEGFAAQQGYAVERQIFNDTHFRYVLTEPATGRATARIGFRLTSTAEGFADLLADEADLVLALREPTPAEIGRAREAGLGDLGDPRRSRVLALDALVPVVSPANPVRRLPLETLADIYAGRVANWAELGGYNLPIARHLRDPLSGSAQLFETRVLSPGDAVAEAGLVRHDHDAALADAVAADPAAIGIATFSETGNAEPVALLGPCGMTASARFVTIKTEDYPLTAPLFIYTPARRLPLVARELLDYVRSDAAQRVIARAGFVNLRIDRVPLSAQGERLANAILAAGAETSLAELQRMARRIRGTRRLTITFRFENGQTDLDAQSRSNVAILARQLEAGIFDGRKLIFVGFSDGEGPADANLRLARQRAETVRKAVLAAALTADRRRLDLGTDAFGEAMPMACDETDWGRQVNRRVEVWVP